MLVILVGTVSPTAAEESLPALVGDRPTFTVSARTIPGGHFQLEAGVKGTDSGAIDEFTFGELLARVGLARRWELRVGLGSYVDKDTATNDVDGFDDPSLEAKFRFNPKNERTAVAVLFGSTLPWGDDEIGSAEGEPFVRLLLDQALTDRLAISGNVGYTRPYADGDRFDQYVASVVLGISASERAGVFFEIYGFNEEEPGGGSSVIGDIGFTWLVTPRFQLDVYVGAGLRGSDIDRMTGVGFVTRW